MNRDKNSVLNFEVVCSNFDKAAASSFFIPVFEEEKRLDPNFSDLNKASGDAIHRILETGENSGKFKEFSIVYLANHPVSRVILVGVGKRKEFTINKFRGAAARAARIARRSKSPDLAVPVGSFVSLDPEESGLAAAEGIILGLYRYGKFKNEQTASKNHQEESEFKHNEDENRSLRKVHLVVSGEKELEFARKGWEKGKILADAANCVRDLVNEPPNIMVPTYFADQAKMITKHLGIEIQVLEKDAIEKMEMGGLLSVGKGSVNPPRLVILKYQGDPKSKFTLGFVGKGVTFDSGGISIKPSENMHTMTSDMAGAAACLGALKAIAELKLPINIISVLPLAENLPDGKAYKPGDIVKMYSGKTVEIINTDAEGRMLLGDALSYITKTLKVDAVVDLATLTGGVVVALGQTVSGVFSSSEPFFQMLMKAAEKSSEKFWPLPLFEEYGMQMKGSLADLKNSGGRYGAPCTAAAFLKEFVGETPWLHLDIAGTAYMEADKMAYQQNPYLPKNGATGIGVRTLVHLAEELSQKMNSLIQKKEVLVES